MLALYGLLTLGAQGIAALGVGVAEPPKQRARPRVPRRPAHRRRAGQPTDPCPPRPHARHRDHRRHGRARRARHRSVCSSHARSTSATAAGAQGRAFRPLRAQADVISTTGSHQARPRAVKVREFVPERRFDAFDQLFARRRGQRLVQADHVIRPESVPHGLRDRAVYVLDGRGRDAAQVDAALADFQVELRHDGLTSGPLVRAAMKLRPAVVVGAGVGIAGAPALAVHSAPSLVALSWLGRHVVAGRWPASASPVTSRSRSTTAPTRRPPRSSSTRSTTSAGTPPSSCSATWRAVRPVSPPTSPPPVTRSRCTATTHRSQLRLTPRRGRRRHRPGARRRGRRPPAWSRSGSGRPTARCRSAGARRAPARAPHGALDRVGSRLARRGDPGVGGGRRPRRLRRRRHGAAARLGLHVGTRVLARDARRAAGARGRARRTLAAGRPGGRARHPPPRPRSRRSSPVAYVFALSAGLCYAIASVFQHRVAAAAPKEPVAVAPADPRGGAPADVAVRHRPRRRRVRAGGARARQRLDRARPDPAGERPALRAAALGDRSRRPARSEGVVRGRGGGRRHRGVPRRRRSRTTGTGARRRSTG